MDWVNKKVMVCGMARSGIAAAGLLHRNGAKVIIYDSKGREELKEYLILLNIPEIELTQNPEDIILNMDLVVLSPGVPFDLPFLKNTTTKGIEVISEIELAYGFCHCPIAAVTGTNGKTTTTALLGEIFKAYNEDSYVVGNIGNAFCLEAEKMGARSLCAAELSSFQLEGVREFNPKAAAILNITPDHLDRHGTVENYIRIKENIFANQSKGDYLVLNYDDEICRNMAKRAKGRVFFFSSQKQPREGAFIEKNSIYLRVKGYNMPLVDISDLKLPGVHNYENVMAAAILAVCMDVPIDIIINTVKSFRGVEHRIEFVRSVGGADYYNDSKATNPDSAIKALYAMNSMKKPVILIGGGYDKGADFTQWIKAFGTTVKHLIVMGETAPLIEKACAAQGFYGLSRAQNLEEAVRLSAKMAEKGDVVLLSPACASWDMFGDFEERGKRFKEYVIELGE